MIVAHLLGGNEIKGVKKGIVTIDDNTLEVSYEDLVTVCGNISLESLDASISIRRSSKDIQEDYIKLVKEYDDTLGEDFVINNRLTSEISYSTYEVDFENESLILKIETC